MEHTKLPWRYYDISGTDYAEIFGPVGPGPGDRLTVYSKDDAQYIAKACNNYERLVDILKMFEEWWRTPNDSRAHISSIEPAMINALEALKSLEEKS